LFICGGGQLAKEGFFQELETVSRNSGCLIQGDENLKGLGPVREELEEENRRGL